MAIITETCFFAPSEFTESSIGESWWNDIATRFIITPEMIFEVEDTLNG